MLAPLDSDTRSNRYASQGDVDVLSSDDSELESEMKHNRRGALGRLPRARLEALLRSLSNTRDKIARVMVLALDRPDAAEEVAEVIIQSLLINSTPVPRKIARLNVISDILHNCAGTPTNAWKYRSLFESKLPAVFTHLGEIYKSFPGRMKAEVFRKQIMTTMEVWEQWLVFNPSVLADLEKRLSTGEDGSDRLESTDADGNIAGKAEVESDTPKGPVPGFNVVKAGATHTSAQPAEQVDDDIDGEALPLNLSSAVEDVDGEPLDGEDLDGAPL